MHSSLCIVFIFLKITLTFFLLKKLQKVSYTHPYVDTYYNRRDNSLMLVFSNPFDESALSNNEDWTIKLHSNVGFRNYLDFFNV